MLQTTDVRKLAGVVLTVLLGALSLIHVYWAAGGAVLTSYTIPTVNGVRVFTPSTQMTLLVAFALIAASAIAAGSVGLLGNKIPSTVFRILLFLVGLSFIVRAIGDFRLFGFFKPSNSSDFAFYDSLVYSPLSLLIGVIAFYIAARRR